MKKGTDFKKGEYVVLLSSCTGKDDTWLDCLAVNTCYKLKKDSYQFSFYPEKDLEGSLTNGWSYSGTSREGLDKLMLREATPTEIAQYDAINGPFKIITPKQLPIFN